MDLISAYKEYVVRFYHWAMKDASREANQGYPLLSRVENETVRRYLDWVKPLSIEERERVFQAFFKFMHPWVLAPIGESLTSEEESINRRFRQPQIVSMSVPTREKYERLIAKQSNRPDKRRTTAIVLNRLASALKSKPTQQQGGWNHTLQYGDWKIETNFEVRIQRSSAISYYQRATRTDFDYRTLLALSSNPGSLALTSIMDWMGLSSQTSFDLIIEDDMEPAADAFAAAVEHYIQEIPPLLEGLGIAD